MFEEFWSIYPRKTAKAHAKIMWDRLSADEQQAAIDALPNHIKYWELVGTSKEYICHAGTWLNPVLGRRWEDELEMPQPKQKSPDVAWWSSEQLILAKGKELGLMPRPGESIWEFKGRVAEKIRMAA